LRLLDVTESGSFDLQPIVNSEGNISNLGANVLAFSITIRPDEQTLRIAGLCLNIFSYRLLSLF